MLPTTHGKALPRAKIRTVPEDFLVDEELGFAPTGAGEHIFVRVEKTGANSEWAARQLAAFAAVPANAVSFAGMKDRYAVTRQTFSIHLPGKRELDWTAFSHPDIRVLETTRHDRKLKRGALKGNRFRIALREMEGDREQWESHLCAVAARGVPNYFGEQRFGRGGNNIAQARAMFAGQRVARDQRSILLSAARAHLFNTVLARRVHDASWDRAMDGDVWMLEGTHSIFGPEALSDELRDRLEKQDIHPTAALWGEGDLRSAAAVLDLERGIAADNLELAIGLERAGLKQERRALRLLIRQLQWQWLEPAALAMTFWLPAGAYATSVLHELCDINHANETVCP